MRELEPGCRQGVNGICPIFVAEAALAGDLDRAWQVLLKSYNKDDTFWRSWRRCLVVHKQGTPCPPDKISPYPSYPALVAETLVETGYVRPGRLRP